MPELPEVETIVRGLTADVQDKIIADVLIKRKDLRQKMPDNLAEILINKQITRIKRRAKYLLFDLNESHSLIVHLGMSGKMILKKKDPSWQKNLNKHDHIAILLNDNNYLVFNDPRRFGLVDIVETDKINDCKLLSVLGIEPLTKEFDTLYLYNLTRGFKTPIKQFLMDGHKVVGIGNIYASESLFMAKIDPRRTATSLDQEESDKLVTSIKEVLLAAIKAGGSSLKDYRNAADEAGYFQHNFAVYSRANQNCKNCSNKISEIRQAGRATYFCPNCQK